VGPLYAGYLFDGLAFILCGLVVYYFKPQLPAARAALAVGLSIGLDLVLALDLFSAGWLQRLCFWTESMMPSALLHFALCFPEPKPAVRRRPILLAAAYLPSIVLGILQQRYLGHDPVAHLHVNDWVYDATAVAGLLSVASLVHTFVSSRSVLARQQAKIVMAGVTFAALVPSFGLLSITLLGFDLPMNLLVPFFFVYPLAIAYAIARHDLFGVDRFLRLGVVYATLSVLVFVSYAGLVLGAERWTGANRLPTGAVPLYLVGVLLVFEPLRARLQALVDRLFSRQAYNYRATVEAASRALAAVLDTDRIATTVLATLIDVMAIEWAVLLLVDAGGRRAYARPPGSAELVLQAFPDSDPALAAALARERLLSTYSAGAIQRRLSDEAVRARFADVGAALVLPVRFQTTAIGLLLVGEKRSGAFYTDEDLDLLETLVHQAAVALTNAGAYEIIRRTQEELVHAERLAAVGELAAAVAHGIRNPLAGIRASAQLAREDAAPGTELAESLDDIVSEADRLEQRIRTILDVTRPLEPKVADRDLAAFLRGFVAATAARLPARTSIGLDLPPTPASARFDAIHLTEVLDTIVVNAVEAMGAAGGAITLGVHDGPDRQGARTLVVTVTDSGPGIDAARIDQVFDLFYTTKPSGTGVGLAVAKRLVERQGGTLAVTSPPGSGAMFAIRLVAATIVT
jgi:signal transduction histidine kinase